MKAWPVGAMVRCFANLDPVPGVVISNVANNGADGGPRQTVRWTFGDGHTAETRYDPALLMPLDSSPVDDPNEIISGESIWRHPRTVATKVEIMPRCISALFLPPRQAIVLRRDVAHA